MNTCKNCQRQFPVAEDDVKFYAKMEVPSPTLCPFCRQQRRLAFRNEINLFYRRCDKTGAQILSMYEQGSPYKIYDQTEWWKDDWDPLAFGRDFDFGRSFFEQYQELRLAVPRMSLNCIANENSYFTNYAWRDKDSYLVTTADLNEQCYYGRFSDRNYRCCDFDFTYDSRFCYETLDTHKSEACAFSQQVEGCSENYFCYNMRNCHNCIFCANLRNQSYCVFNKKVSQDEFKKFKESLKLSSASGVTATQKQWNEFLIAQPRKYLNVLNCEDSVGDYLKNCKNANFCFDCYDLHDVKYASHLFNAKDSYDWDFVGDKCELCYEMVSCAGELFKCRFTMSSWNSNSEINYCDLCLGNEYLFGCVALRKQKYCILNKKYTKEEYEKLVPRIIEHMRKTGEWGEFLPMHYSSFAYNDSVAFEYYPMTKEETLAKGLRWRDSDAKEYAKSSYAIPDDIKDAPDSIVNETLSCAECGKNYKIIAQELKFYKDMKLPVPVKCWLCRHKNRRLQKNPRTLSQRNCSKCGSGIFTTYSADRPEPVYCEKCYLEFVG